VTAGGVAFTSSATFNLTNSSGSPQLTDASPTADPQSLVPLTMPQLAPVIDRAIEDWQATGISSTQVEALRGATFTITSLPEHRLGWGFPPTAGYAGAILIDATASGIGWFIDDNSSAGNGAFPIVAGPAEFDAAPASPASGRIDLLTVVSHELGHILGLPDLVNDHSGALMDEILEPGVRRFPEAIEHSLDVYVAKVTVTPPGSTPSQRLSVHGGGTSALDLGAVSSLAAPIGQPEGTTARSVPASGPLPQGLTSETQWADLVFGSLTGNPLLFAGRARRGAGSSVAMSDGMGGDVSL
jgi:hypothetical protein